MKICVVTATRAEYGLLKPLMDKIREESNMQLLTLVTGAHLSPEFGLTYQKIEEDGISINAKVEMLLSADTPTSIIKSMGLGMVGYADALQKLSPDVVVILGDRYEMLALASSVLIFGVPLVHIHGGEITEGAYDDAIRHAITKMSHLHFASTKEYKDRIVQMGENPEHVFNVGAIGLDNVKNVEFLSRADLELQLNFRFKKFNYQVSFYPETLGQQSPEEQFSILLKALDKLEDSLFIFTRSNADTGGRIINKMIDEYVAKNSDKALCFSSLGTQRFLSVVKECDAIVGNSSSGILEAPSLHTATINIGDRQKGRIQAASILNCAVDEKQILGCFEILRKEEFRNTVLHVKNPYDNGGAASQIIEVLKTTDLQTLKTKHFYDIKQ